MDLRFNYDHIRQQIADADFGPHLNAWRTLVRDIRHGMNMQIDRIEELEKQKDDINIKIAECRSKIKETANQWEI